MDILLILPLAVLTFFIANKLNQKIGLAYAITYIVTGVIIGLVIRNMGYGSINELLPNISLYSNSFLLLMFFAAGFSINIDSIVKSGSTIPKLSFIPSFVETFVIGILMYFLVKYFGGAIDIHLNILETVLIAAILALSSPANVVPCCLELIQGNYKSKNNVQNTMLAVTVTDGFSTLPIILLSLFLAIQKAKGTAFTGSTVLMITVGVLVGIVACGVLGFFLGKLINIITKSFMEALINDKENKKRVIATTIGVFLLSYLLLAILGKVPVVGAAVKSLNVLIICLVGAGISYYDKTGASQIISGMGNMIFAVLGTPIIFLSVGTSLQLDKLFNPNMLIIGIVVTVIAVLIKGTVGKLLLNKDTYTDEERSFVFACFIPKGLALVNFSVIFAGINTGYDSTNVVNFMVMLAGITIIMTIPAGVTILGKAKDKWFTK